MMKFRLVQYPEINRQSRAEDAKAVVLERMVNAEETDGYEFHSMTYVGIVHTGDGGSAHNFMAAFRKRES